MQQVKAWIMAASSSIAPDCRTFTGITGLYRDAKMKARHGLGMSGNANLLMKKDFLDFSL